MRVILTGMRTTGRLHLGHMVGALDNWLELQNSGQYNCYFLLADVQALTTHFDRVEGIEDSVRQVVIDWLSVGLDPARSSFVLQSAIMEYPELTVYLSMLVSMGVLQRNPTLKDEIKTLGMADVNVGFMMYPVSQAADILLLSPIPGGLDDELLVPVGEDQIPHIELTRDIGRLFNNQYGETFVLPREKVGDVPRLADLGGEGKKMGKSAGNAVFLSDPPNIVEEKIKRGFTDPLKARRNDPGRPEICPIFSYQKIFNADQKDEIAADCQSGALGCVDCKKRLAQSLNSKLEPIRERRSILEQQPDAIATAIIEGTATARTVGKETMTRVRDVMHLNYRQLLLQQE